ncbi:O-methyltransferase [Runella sp. SP2]|uniref:O-methyltransferase n=1 Tax=Runella sp. SP2 TaxID=2268026 RepID=UPI000F086CA6|nr:class I SAM-dependent methyltransferase [Runella sp. SP2]AYQ30887.1 methyltransferase domain-containing protein [Runella sp. SP2]
MTNLPIPQKPAILDAIDADAAAISFGQPSDDLTGAFLRTLIASKPAGKFLELGTGAGRATGWMLEGMTSDAHLISVESDEALIAIAQKHLGADPRLQLIHSLGEEVIVKLPHGQFDLIFADTWPGKYNHLEETLALVKEGGFYIIDDMLPQPNWPEGHDKKAANLIQTLENDPRFQLVKMTWASGMIVLVKKA